MESNQQDSYENSNGTKILLKLIGNSEMFSFNSTQRRRRGIPMLTD